MLGASLGAGVDRVGVFLWDALFAAGVFSGVCVLGLLASRQPARRCWLARATLLASLLIMPGILFPPWARTKLNLDVAELLPHSAFENNRNVTIGARAEPAVHRAAADSRWPAHVRRFAVAGYFAGVGIGLGGLVLGCWGVGWLIAQSHEVRPDTQAQVRLLGYVGILPRPAVRTSRRARGPVLAGLFKPVVLIPTNLDTGESPLALQLSLLHEFAHAERFDHWFAWLGAFCQAIWFPLPTFWWIRRQLRLDQEFLADRRAAARFGSDSKYAMGLVDLTSASAAGAAVRPALRHAAAAGQPGSALWSRVLMLVRAPFGVEGEPPRWYAVGVVIACVGLAVASSRAAVRPRWSSPAVVQPLHAHGELSMARIALEPPASIPAHGGAGSPYTLPAPLPQEFDLSLELFASGHDAAAFRIAGCRLAPNRRKDADSSSERWRKVVIRKHARQFSVIVDGERVPDDLIDARDSKMLSLEPPAGHSTLIRNLKLTW